MLFAKLIHVLTNYVTTNQARQIHALIIINGLRKLKSLLIRRILLSSCNYSKSVAHYVQNILYHSKNPDGFSWSCTIRYFSQQGQFKEALFLYVKMQTIGLYPSTFALSSALRACARSAYKMHGVSIHAQSFKFGFCGCVYVETALVDLYSKLADMNTAQKVFDEILEKNVVSWNTILSGYLKSGNLVEAQRIFDQIPGKDVTSWNSIIAGYAKLKDMKKACLLFEQMPERNSASWNTMISGYVDCGNIESARRLFDTMHQRNNVSFITMIAGYSKYGDVESAHNLFDQMDNKDLFSFNAMISCFAQNSQPKEAILLFNEMLKADVDFQPDEMTLASVVSACSQLGDLRFGSWIESYVNNLGVEIDDHLATALVDLYAKHGKIEKAYELFHGLKSKDVVAYSAMILGCAINGKVSDAIKLFEAMIDAEIIPNLATYTGLLTGCNHAGLVEEGYRFFNSMRDHKLVPSIDHYSIMVDLLGRAGRLQEAYELILSMPMRPHTGVWSALLLACRVHNNVELGEIVAQHCFELDPSTPGYYSLLANIYASVGRWDDARRLREVMETKRLVKIPGCSWMEST